MNRVAGRSTDQMRPVRFTRGFTRYAEGSVLVEFGETRVLCTASIEGSVPPFLRGRGRGWVTAEYGMLPRSTNTRTAREAARGRQGGRTLEIQRLIGRSLRAAVNLEQLGEHTIKVDCDVVQADGGTRTASITGGCVAVIDAISYMLEKDMIQANPLKEIVASVSVGIHRGRTILDMDYEEDSGAETDMNIVMTASGGFIEVQGTGEGKDFSHSQLLEMVAFAENGIKQLIEAQQKSLA